MAPKRPMRGLDAGGLGLGAQTTLGDDQIKMAAMAASVHNMDSLSVALDHLEPATEAQKSLLADAKRNYAASGKTEF